MKEDGGHGTQVAGIIGATGNNGEGIAGMVWNSDILGIKACTDGVGCPTGDVAYAVTQARLQDARVINLSLRTTKETYNSTTGGCDPVKLNDQQKVDEDALRNAIQNASLDAVVVVAADNYVNSAEEATQNVCKAYPAAYPGAIAVGAVTQGLTMKSNSRRGDWVHLAAPGDSIRTLMPSYTGGTTTPDGKDTSIAAPHVAGAAALLWAQALTLSSSSIRARLLAAAETMPSLNNNVNQNKFLNAHNAFTMNKATATVTLEGDATCTWNEGSNAFITTYNGSPKPFTATTNPPGIPYTITYNGSSTIPTNAGTYTVVATINSNPYYQGSDSKTLVVGKAAQTITVGPLPFRTPMGSIFTTTATSSSELPVAIVTSGACSGSGIDSAMIIMANAPGTCVLAYNQAGDDNYNAAPQVTRTTSASTPSAPDNFHIVLVSGGSVTLEWDASAGAQGYLLWWGPDSRLYQNSFDVGNTTTGMLTGMVPGQSIFIAVQSYNGPHNSGYSLEVLAYIPKLAGSVSINDIPSRADYGDSFTPTFTKLGDGMASVFSSTINTCTVTAGVVNYVDIGTCTLVASVAEGTNHLSATGTPQSFTVAKLVGIVAGNTYTVGLKSDGTVVAVGYNDSVSQRRLMDGHRAGGAGNWHTVGLSRTARWWPWDTTITASSTSDILDGHHAGGCGLSTHGGTQVRRHRGGRGL